MKGKILTKMKNPVSRALPFLAPALLFILGYLPFSTTIGTCQPGGCTTRISARVFPDLIKILLCPRHTAQSQCHKLLIVLAPGDAVVEQAFSQLSYLLAPQQLRISTDLCKN